jgi:tetratricopeptide (TPR) repeat protein
VHFTPQVESLIRGQTGHLGQDIAYTLSVFPNHHRALIAGMRLAEREKVAKPSGMKYSIDCYFERAMGFARDDNVTRLIYASHLSKSSRTQEALGIVDAVVATAEDNAFTHFNAGLLFLEFGAFDKALTQAHRAAELGFGNPALKNRLQAAGKWVEPTPVAADETRPADAAASAAAPASRP